MALADWGPPSPPPGPHGVQRGPGLHSARPLPRHGGGLETAPRAEHDLTLGNGRVSGAPSASQPSLMLPRPEPEQEKVGRWPCPDRAASPPSQPVTPAALHREVQERRGGVVEP